MKGAATLWMRLKIRNARNVLQGARGRGETLGEIGHRMLMKRAAIRSHASLYATRFLNSVKGDAHDNEFSEPRAAGD